jgi:hypothetical protein
VGTVQVAPLVDLHERFPGSAVGRRPEVARRSLVGPGDASAAHEHPFADILLPMVTVQPPNGVSIRTFNLV